MKKNNRIRKVASLFLATSMLLGQISFGSTVNVYANDLPEVNSSARNVPSFTNPVAGLTIQEGAYGDTHLMTQSEYEETLNLDKEFTLKGYEVGIPITPAKIKDRASLNYSLDGYFRTDDFVGGYEGTFEYLDEVTTIIGSYSYVSFRFDLVDELNPYRSTDESVVNAWNTLTSNASNQQIELNIRADVRSDLKTGKKFVGFSITSGSEYVKAPSDGRHSLKLETPVSYDMSFKMSNNSWEPNKSVSNINVNTIDQYVPVIHSVEKRNNYLFIEFNEPLRVSNQEDYNELMDNYTATVNLSDGTTTTAEFVGVEDDDKTLVMHVEMNGKYHDNVDVTLNSIDFKNSSSNSRYYPDLYAFNSEGDIEKNSRYNGLIKLDSNTMHTLGLSTTGFYPFCDYAGNMLETYDLTAYNLDMTNTSPVVSDIEIKTSMSSVVNEKSPDEWDADINREDFFAGVGDTITITAEVEGQDGTARLMEVATKDSHNLSGLVLELNVKDENGNNIKLPVESVTNSIQEANHPSTGVLVFETLVIEKGMYLENNEHVTPLNLVVESINGSTGIYDIFGNPITTQNVEAIVPKQKAFVDASAPTVSADVVADGEAQKIIFEIKDGDSGSFVSGLQGKSATISLFGNSFIANERQNIEYEYSLDGTTYHTALLTQDGETSTKFSVELTELFGQTIEVYVKTPDTDDLVLKDVKARVSVEDIASNTAIHDEPLTAINIDRSKPEIVLQSSNITYSDAGAKVTTVFGVADTSEVTAKYQFDFEDEVDVEVVDGTVTVIKNVESGDDYSENLTVTVTDNKGNSETLTHVVSVNTELVSTKYSIGANLLVPNASPDITVSSPTAKEDGSNAYTKVTITKNGNTYTQVISSAEEVTDRNIFDFTQGTWYQTTDDVANYTTVNVVDMSTIANSLYGVVNVTLESSYEDLTPKLNGTLPDTTIDTGYNKTEIGSVYYAPAVEAYEVTNKRVYLYEDDNSQATATMVHDQTLYGMRYEFNISNKLAGEYGTSDIDIDNSFITISDPNGNVVAKKALANSSAQVMALPNIDYISGEYTASVTITQKSGISQTFDLMGLFVDNAKITHTGLYYYADYITSPTGGSIDYVTKYEQDRDISVDSVFYFDSEGKRYQAGYYEGVVEDTVPVKYYYETNPDISSDFFLGTTQHPVTVNGESVGEIKDVIIWVEEAQKFSYRDASRMDDYRIKNFEGYYGYVANLVYPFGSSYNQLGFKSTGENTVYYQIELTNGNLSPVQSFTINMVNDPEVVTADVNYDIKDYYTTTDGEKLIASVDVSLSNVKSIFGGDVTVTRMSREYDEVSESYSKTGEFVELPYNGEKINLNYEKHEYNFIDTQERKEDPYYDYAYTKEYFILTDEFGNSAEITPFFGNEISSAIVQATEYNMLAKTYLFNEFTLNGRWYSSGSNYENSFVELAIDHDGEGVAQGVSDISVIDFNRSTIQLEYSDGTLSDKIDVFIDNPVFNDYTGYVGAEWSDPLGTAIDSNTINFKFANPIDPNKAGEIYAENIILNAVSEIGVEEDFYISYKDYVNEGYSYPTYQSHILTDDSQDTSDENLALADADNKIYFNTYAYIDKGDAFDYYQMPTDMNAHLVDIKATDAYGNSHVFDAKTNENEGAPTVTSIVGSTQQNTVSRAITKEPLTLVLTGDSNLTVSGGDDDYPDYDEKISIDNNGTKKVTVTLNYDTEITVKDSSGNSYFYDVKNFDLDEIKYEEEKEIVPSVEFTDKNGKVIEIGEEQIIDGEVTANLYIANPNGSVKEYLVDSNGDEITYTFDPKDANFTYDYSIKGGTYFDSFNATGKDFSFNLSRDYNIKLRITDVTAPSVQITVDASNGVQTATIDRIYSYVPENPEASHPELPKAPSGTTVYDDIAQFTGDLGYAPTFILNYEIADRIETEIYIKQGTLDAVPADTTSDTIDGVELNLLGSNIEITKSAEFTIFITDDNGNTSIIPISVTMTDKPDFDPIIEEVDNGDYVRVYVSEDNLAVDSIRIVSLSAKVETATGEHKGKAYIDLTTNEIHLIQYNYIMNGLAYSGYKEITTNGIIGDTALAIVGNILWSSNSKGSTNTDVTAIYTLNKDIVAIDATEAVKTEVESGNLEFTARDDKFTLVYKNNVKTPHRIELTAADGTTLIINTEAVENITKTAPTITHTETLAEDGSYMNIKFTSTIDVNFKEGGASGRTFNKKIYENGEYEFNFTDAAGNTATENITINSIVSEDLQMTFALSQSGEFTEDANSFDLSVGDVIWVKVNRASTVTLNSEEKSVVANTATSFTVSDPNDGYTPSISAVDTYGNRDYFIFRNVKTVDVIAPKIIIRENEIFARLSDTKAEIESDLTRNAIVVDNEDSSKVVLTFDFDMRTTAGTENVTYIATDPAGNTKTETMKLRFVSDDEPQPTVNDEFVERNGVVTVTIGEHELIANLPKLNGAYEEYTVLLEKGIKTVAQLKIGSTVLEANNNTNSPIDLEFEETGYYTVCIKTQGRDYYSFIVYVE